MPTQTTSLAWNTLKSTLDNIVTDKMDGMASSVVWKDYMASETMSDNYVDDLEVAGPGLATEKAEGQALDVGSIYEGYMTRYMARKFGLILQITEELEEDGKYNDKYIAAAKRLKRAIYKTQDVDAGNMLNRGFNSLYVGGDGLSMWNSAHTLPAGGTFSNTLAVPFSPSRAALIVVIQNVMQLPGQDGIVEGYNVVKLIHPIAQWGAWKGILQSAKVPESANNEDNVVKGMATQVPVWAWNGTTTNWAVTTDAPEGMKFKIRRQPRGRDWVDNPTETHNYGISARWCRGWTNPRGTYGSNA